MTPQVTKEKYNYFSIFSKSPWRYLRLKLQIYKLDNRGLQWGVCDTKDLTDICQYPLEQNGTKHEQWKDLNYLQHLDSNDYSVVT
jgi:hypothetical protein